MKKAILFALLLSVISAVAVYAEPYSIVNDTETVSIVSVSTKAATLMDSTAPGNRVMISIQNQSADIFACTISSVAPATVTSGFEIAMSTHPGNIWTRMVRRSNSAGAMFRTYCQSKGTGAFGTAAVYQAGSK